MTKFEDVPEEVLTDPTMRTALGMNPIPGMNTPVDDASNICGFVNEHSGMNLKSVSATATDDTTLTVINEQEVLGKHFRIFGTIDNPLFLAKDVAEWIEHSNQRMMLQSIDDDEKVKVNNVYSENRTGGNGTWFLTEDGLYEVLMQSRKPIAKSFKKKVKEILKSIRKNGAYIRNQENMTPAEIVARGLIAAQGKDVATALGYCNINKAVAAHVDEDDKKVLDFKGFSQNRKSSGLWVGHDFSSKTIINGKDVAAALGFTNSRDAIATHVFADDKGVESIDTLGGRQKMTIINESGLYALVFGSRLKIAKDFKHWVTSKVLPSIRKNGAYIRNQENMTPAEIVAAGLIAAQKIIEEREKG